MAWKPEAAGTGRSAEGVPAGLRAGLEEFIGSRTGSPVSVRALARLRGGTMRHAWAVDVEIASGELVGHHRLLYLQDRAGPLVPSRLRPEHEHRVLSVMHASGVRVPKPLWSLGQHGLTNIGTGLILECVEGETVARRILRDSAFEHVRPRLLEQLGVELAKIHAVRTDALEGRARQSAERPPAETQLAELEATLRGIGEPHPALELALRWLQQHVPDVGRRVVVHGDYRLGNFVVDPERGLRAVLDWELSHVGDPWEDLAWLCLRFWRCVDHAAVRGIGPRHQFLDAYAASTGTRLDPDLGLYWEVLGNLRWAIITLAQARRHLSGHEPSLELASIGRRCAEVEWELLRLLGSGV